MSVRFVGRVGQFFGSGASLTMVITTTTAIPVGQFLVLASRTGNGRNIVSITDTSGNTWNKLENSNLSGTVASVWYCTVTTAMATSSTITVTFSSSLTAARGGAVWAFDGVTRPTTTNATASTAGATSLTVGNVTPTQYSSLFFSAAATGTSQTFAVSAGWTVLPVTASVDVRLSGAYAIGSSMDALGTTWTFGTSNAAGAVSGTFTDDGGDMLAIF